jgi:hypothetical protein
MTTPAYTRISVIILAALALAACPGKKNKHHDDDEGNAAAPNFYVNAPTGADTNRGTQASPFKTITHAMSLSKSGSTVQVAPGTYDVANGEVFPITVPAGVLLIGDEAHKGGGSAPTSIVGGGQVPASPVGTSAALLPGTGSTIAGFTVTNNNGSFSVRRGLSLGNSTVTLRNDTVTGATHQVGVYIDASINHVITGNRIVDNGSTSTGLAFSKGGVGSKVENNVITGNGFGVEYDVAGGDLGGGSAGSTGGNLISCNTQNDLVSFAQTAITITAASNLWDHAPASRGSNPGDDIFDSSGIATINATPAAQTSNPSPCASVTVTLYVSFSTGSDANPGTQASPFKTITHAMSVATSGTTVQVAPGIYDTMDLSTPEVFPITVPAGVLLIGDEASKGSGTSIVGGGQVPGFPAGTGAALLPGTGSTIAGFTITNNNPALSGRYGVFLSNSTVTLRSNTVTGATHVVGVYVADDGGTPPTPSTNHVITGNRIVDNAPGAGEGLAFISGGAGSKVENNVITGNGFGIEYEIAGVDLGGGSALSAGGNVISCNGVVDLYVGVPVAVPAKNNLWDHSPPGLFGEPSTPACTFGGDDICDASAGGAATIDTSNATLASPVCP